MGETIPPLVSPGHASDPPREPPPPRRRTPRRSHQGEIPDLDWHEPIALLFIDGLHDYANVLRDFRHFERHIVRGGLIAFHDYAWYCPDVKRCVDELLAANQCEFITQRDSLVICRRPSG